jgi:hypothetical protein
MRPSLARATLELRIVFIGRTVARWCIPQRNKGLGGGTLLLDHSVTASPFAAGPAIMAKKTDAIKDLLPPNYVGCETEPLARSPNVIPPDSEDAWEPKRGSTSWCPSLPTTACFLDIADRPMDWPEENVCVFTLLLAHYALTRTHPAEHPMTEREEHEASGSRDSFPFYSSASRRTRRCRADGPRPESIIYAPFRIY